MRQKEYAAQLDERRDQRQLGSLYFPCIQRCKCWYCLWCTRLSELRMHWPCDILVMEQQQGVVDRVLCGGWVSYTVLQTVFKSMPADDDIC